MDSFPFPHFLPQGTSIKVYRVLPIVFSCMVIFCGCTKQQKEDLAKAISPLYPKKAATHVVELVKVQIGANDFNLSTFGNPLNINVSLLQDGNPIATTSNTLLNGTRGERLINPPITWTVHFNPNSNYQIRLEEQALIANASTWSIPATPKLGLWPVAMDGGHIAFGKNSYAEFRDKVAD